MAVFNPLHWSDLLGPVLLCLSYSAALAAAARGRRRRRHTSASLLAFWWSAALLAALPPFRDRLEHLVRVGPSEDQHWTARLLLACTSLPAVAAVAVLNCFAGGTQDEL